MMKPDPLTPPDSDLSDFGFMPFDVARFRRSDLATQEDPEAIVAAIFLWGAAWHSQPAASLSNDDRSLAQAAGYGRAVDAFRAIKAGALRGFIECSDGRLYHPVVAEKALASWESKLKRLWRTDCARIRKANERARENGGGEQQCLTFEEFRDAHAQRHSESVSNVTRDNPSTSRATEQNVTRDIAPMSHATSENVTRDNDETPLEQDEPLDDPSASTPEDIQEPNPENERNVTSRGHAPHVTRDIASDSCARATRERERDRERETLDDFAPATSSGGDDEFPTLEDEAPISDAEPESEPEAEDAQGIVGRVNLLARKAGLNVTVPAKLSRAIDQLKEWESEGFGFEDIVTPTIERVTRENPSETIHSLRYFDGAIRKAAAIAGDPKAKPAKPSKPRDPIAARDGDDERVAKVRRRLQYHAGEFVYETRFAPEHMALELKGRQLVAVFRSEAAVALAKRDEAWSHLEGIAKADGLELSARGLS